MANVLTRWLQALVYSNGSVARKPQTNTEKHSRTRQNRTSDPDFEWLKTYVLYTGKGLPNTGHEGLQEE